MDEAAWKRIRIALIAAYVAAYVWWFVERGIIIDRISVLLSVVLFLIVATIGRPWQDWLRLARDAGLFVLMWVAYDESRGIADRIGMPIQVESVRDIDRFLFFGTRPDGVAAVPLLRGRRQRPLVRRRRLDRVLLALHRATGRDRHAVRRQPAPVEPLHATVRHRAVRRLHDVRPPADRTTVDGRGRPQRRRPATRCPRAAEATDRQRLAPHRARRVREGVGHRP